MRASSNADRQATTRRSILRWSGIGAVATITGIFGWRKAQESIRAARPQKATDVASVPQGEKLPPPPPTVAMSREAFVPHLDSEFVLQTDALSTKKITLIEVSAPQTLHSKTAEFTAFSLLFAAPKKFETESRVYRLIHEQMGAMDLFLSPVGDGKKRVLLEACFTQRV
jgi:hypothetical protein